MEQRIAASPTTVFSYLIEPDKFVQWMGIDARIDPRPGGAFRLDVDGEHIAIGQFSEVDPPRRLVLTFGWEGNASVPPGSTTVEITLAEEGSGTLLKLRHTGLPNDEERATHRRGWRGYVARLADLQTAR